ncbi:MAG TPA: ATP-binding cassette domain-containing protein [Bacilli bacterium]|nr:ATP-binding cassette domain-containing protein [Bacilli bacterium]
MIRAEGLTKYYRVTERKTGRFAALRTLLTAKSKLVTAVSDMNFEIPRGGFVGYIGPNGAGKSTTIKMLTGILHPDGGRVEVAGFSPQEQRKEVAQRMGVVFGQRTQLWWDLPCKDSFELLAAMYKVERREYDKAMSEYASLLDIGEFIDTPVRKLSLGQRMRADLVAALLHNPEILFLDEPTIGLDVVAKTRIRSFLKELNQAEEKTILLTTHDMDDIEQLCKQIIIINHGQKVYDGTLEELREQYPMPSLLDVEFHGFVNEAHLPEGAQYDPTYNRVKVLFDKVTTRPMPLIDRLGECAEVRDIQIQTPRIEEVIRQIYQEGHAAVKVKS